MNENGHARMCGVCHGNNGKSKCVKKRFMIPGQLNKLAQMVDRLAKKEEPKMEIWWLCAACEHKHAMGLLQRPTMEQMSLW